ncbi:unnamed protein product [Diamesa hyperborea]
MKQIIVMLFLVSFFSSNFAENDAEIGEMIKHKISKDLCFKIGCLSSPSSELKIIAKLLKLWQNEITFLESLLVTMGATKDLNEIDNFFNYKSFLKDEIDLNQFLSTIIRSNGLFDGISDLKNAAKEINSSTTNLSTEIKNAIKTFTDDIQISFATRNGIPALDVTGNHIVLSEIISRIELLLTDNPTIIMVNFNAIVIHIDVGLSNEIWNGKIIDVIVGKINVHGSIEWNVSGLNGDTESEDQSQIHGGNGGLVIIEADYIINSSFWTIKANGGNGRDGQEGGQITDGVDGQSVSIDTIKKAVKWVWDECTYGEGTKYTDIDGFSCEYVCHWDGFTKFKLSLCNGKDPIAPSYITAVSIGNPGQSGTIIINSFNGASSVKRSSVPGQPTFKRTIEKKTKIGKRGTDRGAYDQTSKNPVYFHSRSSTLLTKVYQVDNCPYCVWNSKMDYYAFIDEIANC